MNTVTAITLAALTALTPTFTCLIGIVLARQDIRDFRVEIRGEMTALRDMVHADMLLIHDRVAKIEGKQTR
jgi:hypothetical protein